MEKKCKNRKCQRSLYDGYKHKYCENCRNDHVQQLKNAGKAVLGCAVMVITIASKGRINSKK